MFSIVFNNILKYFNVFEQIVLLKSADNMTMLKLPRNRPRSIYQYPNMAPRLSPQTSIFGVVFFLSKSLLGIEGQKKIEKFAILTRKPRSST